MTGYERNPNPHRSMNRYALAVLVLAFFSFAMSAFISQDVFHRLPHLEDELAYLYQARVFAGGQIVAESPSPFRPYWQPFVVDHSSGTRFGKYPPGWPALLAPGVAIGQPWVVNAVLAMLTVALVYRLGREIFSPQAGLIAAALTAFSPMALLLNGTLMAHSSALFFVTLFVYAYWRAVPRTAREGPRSGRPRRLMWGLVAGLALGMVAINRPLTAVGIALPFILWSGVLLARLLLAQRDRFLGVFRPLVALGITTLLVMSAIPLFSYAATGDPRTNLYELVWPYDRIGFGEGYGFSGHTIQRGVMHARYDLSLMAADLFGWQLGLFGPETAAERAFIATPDQCNSGAPMSLQAHLRSCAGFWRVIGLSWLVLLSGLLVGFRRFWAFIWLAVGLIWVALLPELYVDNLSLWLLYGLGWFLAPLLFIVPRLARADHRPAWTWLLFGAAFGLVTVHLAYWIGSQRYSTRYYFEALTVLALIGALPFAWMIERARSRVMRGAVFFVVAVLCLWSLFMYSLPRIEALTGFNRVSEGFVAAIEARRTTYAPLLVLAVSEPDARITWRATGALMGMTSPRLDSEIVVAWDDSAEGRRDAILERFPYREVIEIGIEGEDAWFPEDCTGTGEARRCTIINPSG